MRLRAATGAALFLATLATGSGARAELPVDATGRDGSASGAHGEDTHVVQPDETLGAIAVRYGVSLRELQARNPDVRPDRIHAGQEIVVGDERRSIDYAVRAGDTLGAIAKRFGVSVDEILRFNAKLDARRMRPGQVLRVRTKLPASWSRSIGMPSHGKLVHGRRLAPHPGYVIRDRTRAWGTDETVDALVRAFDALRELDSNAPRIEVHDISFERGGRISDHKSHESGRDVDLALFRKNCTRVCDFRRIGPDALDAERQWALLRHLIERDQVEAVFLDYALQEPLYRQARARGATAEQLQRWFQYPNGPGHPLGTVRHFRKHDDHLHVRFACHASDPECRSLRSSRTEHASR